MLAKDMSRIRRYTVLDLLWPDVQTAVFVFRTIWAVGCLKSIKPRVFSYRLPMSSDRESCTTGSDCVCLLGVYPSFYAEMSPSALYCSTSRRRFMYLEVRCDSYGIVESRLSSSLGCVFQLTDVSCMRKPPMKSTVVNVRKVWVCLRQTRGPK
jgi:hypothetical protein